MVVYNGCIVQLRGSREAVRLLLKRLEVTRVALQAPLDCEDLIEIKFHVFEQKATVILLSLNRGEDNLKVTAEPETLSIDDAGEIAELMREVYPKVWRAITAEGITVTFAEASWLGIRHEGKLVAFGEAVPTPPISDVAWIATLDYYRNKGFAASILSALLRELSASSSTAFIYVTSNNPAAIRLYSKFVFKPYTRYFYVKA